MQAELKDNLLKWALFLSAIAFAFVLTSKKTKEITEDIITPENSIASVANTTKIPLSHIQPHIVKKPILNLAASSSTIFLFGQVGDLNSESISQRIIDLNTSSSKEPVLLIIDSPGGAVFAGAKIVSAIEHSKRPVYTVCYGMCASMAAMIHQYGHKRLLTDRSVLMFHNAAGGLEGEVPKMLSRLNMINLFVNKMDSYVAKRAGMEYNEFSRLRDNELWVDAEDALNVGLSDQTVVVNLSKAKQETLLPFTNYKKEQKKGLAIETVTNISKRKANDCN